MASVRPRVSILDVLDDEDPLVRGAIVPGHETLVSRVRVLAHGQDVHVTVPDPGHLKRNHNTGGNLIL